MTGDGARSRGARLGTLALCVVACTEPRTSGHGDAGPNADAAVADSLCIPGHDPNAPALQVVELYAHRPLALRVSGGFVGQIFAYVLSTSPVLLSFDALDDDTRASLSVGTATNADGVYAFDPALPPPAMAAARIDGTTFASDPADTILRGQPPGIEEPVDLRLHDAAVAGEFTTAERCSIGQPHPASPGWRLGATLRGSISVADALDATILYDQADYTLCQILAGMLEFFGSDTGCEDVREAEWPYQPDAMIPDGDGGLTPAWTVDADFAATAVLR